MENYCKLFLFPILIFQILFGCAEPSGGSGGSTSGDYSSTSNNDSKNDNSNEDSSKKPQAISQDISVYLNEKAQIKLTKKTKYHIAMLGGINPWKNQIDFVKVALLITL